jgi:uncharacterized protein YndB with AHSA1/START domain
VQSFTLSPLLQLGDLESEMTGNTVQLHRVFKAPPERIYRAFLTASAFCKWLPPNGFYATVEHMDARVGGTFRMSFTSMSEGFTHNFGGEYLELEPNARIRYTDKFDDPSMPNVMQVTITLTPVACGTELHALQENIPSQIPVEMCYLGWQDSMNNLAQLVDGL